MATKRPTARTKKNRKHKKKKKKKNRKEQRYKYRAYHMRGKQKDGNPFTSSGILHNKKAPIPIHFHEKSVKLLFQ